MNVEGKGQVAPAGVSIKLARATVEWLRHIAIKRNEFRQYVRRSDKWGVGVTSDPVLVGLCGEHALCEYINSRIGASLSIDSRLLQRGDGGSDVEIAGLSIQVKTKNGIGKRNLIRRVDSRRNLRALSCDVFVFAELLPDCQSVRLIGWQKAKAVRSSTHQRSSIKNGDWWNLYIPDNQLLPMNRLIDEIVGMEFLEISA